MIYLAPKSPSPELVDYQLDMTEFVPEGFSIDEFDVTITDSGNGESPLALTVQDVSAQPIAEGEEDNVVLVFWLAGGTAGVRYRGRIEISDDQSSDPDRKYVRQFEVEVEDL